MHPDVRERIEDLQKQTRADSMAEVIRRALALYSTLYVATRAGGKIVVENVEREREVVVPEFEYDD